MSLLIGLFLVVENAIVVLPDLPGPGTPVPLGMHFDHDQGQAVWPDLIGAPNSPSLSAGDLWGVSIGRGIGRHSIHDQSRDAV